MEEEERRPRKRVERDNSAFVTFILVVIILILSGVLVYLRYGDLMMNRLYQFTDGKIGAETGVTSLPGQEKPLFGATGANDEESGDADADSGAMDGDSGEPGAMDGESGETGAMDGESGDADVDSGEPGAMDGESGETGAMDGESGETGAMDGESGETAPESPDDISGDTLFEVYDPSKSDAELTAMYYNAAKALPDGITLSTHDFTLRTLGESVTVRVTGGSDGPFTWVSQNPDVAEVDSSGKITARSHGTVNVIVTDGVKKGVCVARMITGATSATAKLNTSDFTRTVEEGEYQLKVSGVDKPIRWTSEDESVAIVDENGLVIPVGKGQTRIRAAWDDGYLICIVRVPG